jgi:hypothetical protein
LYVVDHFAERSAGKEDLVDPRLVHLLRIRFGDGSAATAEESDVLAVSGAQFG